MEDVKDIPHPSTDADEWSDDEFEGYVCSTEPELTDQSEDDITEKCPKLETKPAIFNPGLPEYTRSPGCKHNCGKAEPLDFFKMLWTNEILDNIVAQTNLYADQFIAENDLSPHSRARQWSKETFTREELERFISLIIVMGLVNFPSLEDHWSTKWPYSSQTCSKVLKRDRFTLILRFLHLNDKTNYIPKGQQGHDPLFKLRPLLNPLISNYQAAYTLHRELSIDEAMIGFKGRLSFLQYLPKKPTKWGMKAYVLADSCNGYVYNWKLYTGKDDALSMSGKSHPHAVVLYLLKGLQGRGHHIYLDNYYTSLSLFSELLELGFGACGTVRVSRRWVPAEMKVALDKGDTTTKQIDHAMMLKWMDKRPVTMLSTIHDESMITKVCRKRKRRDNGVGEQEIKKPTVVEKYNQFMGGVDRSDQLLSYYGFSHRTVKWWKRALFHLLDMTIVNAYVLYSTHAKSNGANKKLTHEQFRIQLAKALLLEASVDVGTATSASAADDHSHVSSGRIARKLPPQSRLEERHFIDHIPGTQPGKKGQKECIVCSRKKGRGRKTTSYQCKQCNLPMCIISCFELYHTRVDPQRYL